MRAFCTALAWRLTCISLVLTTLVNCSGDQPTEAANPSPVLISANPARLVMGSGATTLTLYGSGFVSSSHARWNGHDRVTHFQSASTLTVDLMGSDLSSIGVGSLIVLNPSPGGGTSGTVSVPIDAAVPIIVSVTPSSFGVQPVYSTEVFTITVIGTGFAPQASLRLGISAVIPSSVTPTQLVANVPYYYLSTPGYVPLTVVNPAPGGGTSNPVDFGIRYPPPIVDSLSPAVAGTGVEFTLDVWGAGFGPGSVVQWNSLSRPTTFVSASHLAATIPASDVTATASVNVTVVSPSPGGGGSNTIVYQVHDEPPKIANLSPGVITAGATATTVTLTGTNFHPGATAQIDGQDRTAVRLSGTTMTITLPATDLARARVGMLTVTNPSTSGRSNGMALIVVTPGADVTVERVVSLRHTDLVYDPQRAVFYASVPHNATQYANSVVRVDASTGTITGSIVTGSSPAPLAITENEEFLYVGLAGAPRVVRIALSTFTTQFSINIPNHSYLGAAYAEDIVAIPGLPETIAVTTATPSFIPRNLGTYLFDNSVPRTVLGPDHTGSNRITRGPTGERIYGYNNESTEFGFRSLLIKPDGLHEETIKGASLIYGFGEDIEYDGGLIFATTGSVIDPGTMTKLGSVPTTGVVCPDVANGRVHFLRDGTIRTYHYRAFAGLGTYTDPKLAEHTKLVHWGTNGLAAGGGSTIVLLRGSLISP